MSTSQKNFHISHDTNVDFFTRTVDDTKSQSVLNVANTGINFASEIIPHIKSLRFTRKDAISWKKSPFNYNVHSYCRDAALQGSKSPQLKHRQFNIVNKIKKTSFRIVEDPQLPTGTKVQKAYIWPRVISSCNMMSIVVFAKIQKRRSLVTKEQNYSSDSNVFRYRTIGKMMGPFNLSGGTFIPHIENVETLLIFERNRYSELFGCGHFSHRATIFCQNIKLCTEDENYLDQNSIRQNTIRPLLIPLKARRNALQNSFDESLFIFAPCYVGKEYTNNHKTAICYWNKRGEEETTQLLTSFEATQSISVEVRGELLHLLYKSGGFRDQIKKKNTLLEESSKPEKISDGCNRGKQKQREKRKKKISRSPRTEQKRLKKKSKERIKKRSTRKRKRMVDMEGEKVEVIKVPSLHAGSTPVIVTHEKYEVTSIQQNSNINICHQQMYAKDMTMKNVTKHIEQVPRIAFPSFPLGVTPVSVFPKSRALTHIDHGKKLEKGVEKVLSTQTTPQSTIEAGNSSKSNQNHSMGRDVQLFATFKSKFEKKTESDKLETVGKDQKISLGHNTLDHQCIESNQSDNTIAGVVEPSPILELPASELGDLKRALTAEKEIFSLLCSENFLETWSHAASELSSGNWVNNVQLNNQIERNYTTLINKKICLHDCILVDECCVDIELPNNSSIKIISLASWSSQNKTANPKEFIRDFVQLVASDRYKMIHLIFVIDSSELNQHIIEIVNLQNAIIKQQGCPCDCLCIQYIQANLLSTTVAMIASKDLINHSLEGFLFEENVMEQARFLLSILPALTVYDCLQFFRLDAKIVLRDEMVNISNSHNDINARKKSTQQLKVAMNTLLQNYQLN